MEKTSDLIGKRKKKIEDLKNKEIDLFPNVLNVEHLFLYITGVF